MATPQIKFRFWKFLILIYISLILRSFFPVDPLSRLTCHKICLEVLANNFSFHLSLIIVKIFFIHFIYGPTGVFFGRFWDILNTHMSVPFLYFTKWNGSNLWFSFRFHSFGLAFSFLYCTSHILSSELIIITIY